MHLARPVHRSQYLVLAEFNECRAVGIFHSAHGYLYFAKLVNAPPVCPFSIFVYQISCLSHFSPSTSSSSSTSSTADSTSGFEATPTGARDASCCCGGEESGTFRS